MSDSFIPPMEPMGGVAPVFWRYNPILPLVFTYELTYMEQVASLCKKLNDIAESSNKQGENVQRLYDAYVALENSVMGRTGAWVVATMLVDGIINTAKLANGAVTGEKLANGSVGTQHIANGAITHDKLADNCVDQRHIDPGAVNSSQIAGGAILPEHLGDELEDAIHRIMDFLSGRTLIPSNLIADGAITYDKLAANCVDRRNIEPGAVGTSQIANSVITSDHLVPELREKLNATGGTDMGGAVLHNLGEPVEYNDAATKEYADSRARNRFSTMSEVGLYFQNNGGGVCTYAGEQVDATGGTERMLCVADSYGYGKWSFWAITKDGEFYTGRIDLATGQCTLN